MSNTKKLLVCIDDRDPISMNIFWTESENKRTIIYPKKNIKNLVFYTDSKSKVRCFEKESLQYLKTYKIFNHPVTGEMIPMNLFDNIEIICIDNEKTNEEYALDVFQYFSKISIFIDHHWFLNLNKVQLIKFHYEMKDFWLQNFSEDQKKDINTNPILAKDANELERDDINTIQLYLLNQMKMMLSCEKDEYKYMINYIIVGALGLVIPDIKDLYPDFAFAF